MPHNINNMYFKKLRLPFMLFLAILFNQSCSLLATFPQPKQGQLVNTVAIDQSNKLYRKKVIVGVISIVLHCLNVFFFLKKRNTVLDHEIIAFSFGYLFLSCFSYHQHLNSFLASKNKTPEGYSIFEFVLLIFSIVLNAIFVIKKPMNTFNKNLNEELLIYLVWIVIPMIYITSHTIKYEYGYPRKEDKSVLSMIKRCIAMPGVLLDWVLFMVALIVLLIDKGDLLIYLVLSYILPTIYTARESQLRLKDQPFGANLCSVIELIIGVVAIYLHFKVSPSAATNVMLFASIWVIFKNLVLILLQLIQRYQKRIKYNLGT